MDAHVGFRASGNSPVLISRVAQSFYVSLKREDARKEPARRELRACRKEVARTVDEAKNDWICARCSQLNGDSDACDGHEAYWTACKELLGGLQKPTALKALRMRKPDGDLATNDAENLSVLAPFYRSFTTALRRTTRP